MKEREKFRKKEKDNRTLHLGLFYRYYLRLSYQVQLSSDYLSQKLRVELEVGKSVQEEESRNFHLRVLKLIYNFSLCLKLVTLMLFLASILAERLSIVQTLRQLVSQRLRQEQTQKSPDQPQHAQNYQRQNRKDVLQIHHEWRKDCRHKAHDMDKRDTLPPHNRRYQLSRVLDAQVVRVVDSQPTENGERGGEHTEWHDGGREIQNAAQEEGRGGGEAATPPVNREDQQHVGWKLGRGGEGER